MEDRQGRIRRHLRPTRKVTDMFLLAFLITFLLILAGQLFGEVLLPLMGFPHTPSTEKLAQITQGTTTTEEAVGAPAYLTFAAMYISFIGIWLMFILAMAIPPSNRKMLSKLFLVRDRRSLALTCIGVLVGFGINAVCVLISVALGNVQLHLARFEAWPFALLLFSVFVQSGAEEIACRLFLYQKLARRYRHPAVAPVLSAVFFAAVHGLNPGLSPIGVAQLVITGVLLSLFIYYYDSLGACMAMHTAWNFTQSIFFGLPNSGVASLYSVFVLDKATSGFFFDPGFGVEGSAGSLVFLSLACVGLAVYAKRHDLRPKDLWAEAEPAKGRHLAQ